MGMDLNLQFVDFDGDGDLNMLITHAKKARSYVGFNSLPLSKNIGNLTHPSFIKAIDEIFSQTDRFPFVNKMKKLPSNCYGN